jgi:hypothetical protein
LYIFFPKFKNEFEVAISGLKGNLKVGTAFFRQKNSKNTNFSKPAKPLWDQEKSRLEGPVYPGRFSSRSLKIILSTVFGGSKLAIFPARCDLGHEANPKKPEIDEGVPGFGAPERI